MTLNELCDVLEDHDVTIVEFELPKSESLSIPIGERYYIGIDRKLLKSSHDEKEKIAHEGGHCVRNVFYTKKTKYETKQRIENKAWTWAIKKLVPLNELRAAVNSGTIDLWDLAERFDVSNEFMGRVYQYYKRAEGLGI